MHSALRISTTIIIGLSMLLGAADGGETKE